MGEYYKEQVVLVRRNVTSFCANCLRKSRISGSGNDDFLYGRLLTCTKLQCVNGVGDVLLCLLQTPTALDGVTSGTVEGLGVGQRVNEWSLLMVIFASAYTSADATVTLG